jgi:type VI secretion system protein ImpA
LAGQESVPDTALIGAAFQDCELDALEADAAAVDAALQQVGLIESFVTEKVGAAETPDLDSLTADLKAIKAIFAEHLRSRGVAVDIADSADQGAPPTSSLSGDINTREDVVRMIEKICAYYERAEPSSPVPMLLQRAKRLVAKDYLEIMRDLTPDAVAQAELLGVIKRDDSY